MLMSKKSNLNPCCHCMSCKHSQDLIFTQRICQRLSYLQNTSLLLVPQRRSYTYSFMKNSVSYFKSQCHLRAPFWYSGRSTVPPVRFSRTNRSSEVSYTINTNSCFFYRTQRNSVWKCSSSFWIKPSIKRRCRYKAFIGFFLDLHFTKSQVAQECGNRWINQECNH